MPLNLKDDAPINFPPPNYLTLQNFRRGVITLIDRSRLPQNALEQADNIYLVEDGQPSLRPGVSWYGAALSVNKRTTSVTTVNLCQNPNFEYGAYSWFSSSNSGLGISTTDYHTGSKSLSLAFTAANTSGRTTFNSVAGKTYIPQAWVKATAGTDLFIEFSGVAGTNIHITASGGWDFLVGEPGVATGASMTLGIGSGNTSGTLYIDNVQIEEGSVATDYFDGDMASTDSDSYSWLGTAPSTSQRVRYVLVPASIDGIDYFDSNGTAHLVAAIGGKVYRSTTDGASWDQCTTSNPYPLTPDTPTYMNQNGNFLYLTNGVDNILRYDGTTTLQIYTALATPTAPTLAATPTGGTSYTYFYKIAAVNSVGFSAASAKTSVTHNTPRSAWDKTSNFVTLTLPAYQTGQTRYDIYFSEDDINYYYLDSQTTPNLAYKDDGSAVVVPSTLAPLDNTTQGPKVAELTNVGVRQFGVRDKDHRYRIWFTGTGNFAGAFSSAYDGGYLDWQPGGKLIPVKVADYRDGKGTPIATIWCNSSDGQGAVIQMSLETLTVGQISITVPNAYALPGSRGTPAPGSVVNVLNDYFFYNSQAIYNLGSRAQFLNLLSTDEASANIRPTIKQVSATSEPGIASVYFDAKVLFSVGIDSSVNNQTILYDCERKAWLPAAFTIGFKKFLRYTGKDGVRRLLAIKPGDTQLSEISDRIQGDYGKPFRSSLLTGLYSTNKDRFEFQFTEEAEFEFSNPTGTITVELLGYERKSGYIPIKQKSVIFTGTISSAGWDTFDWDVKNWDDTSAVPKATSESSVMRYFVVQKELNSVQWHVSTDSLDAGYVLRTLQTWGTATQAGHPTRWRIH